MRFRKRVGQGFGFLGELGKVGTVIETVTDCTLTFPEEISLGKDCNGVDTRVRGTVTVSPCEL